MKYTVYQGGKPGKKKHQLGMTTNIVTIGMRKELTLTVATLNGKTTGYTNTVL